MTLQKIIDELQGIVDAFKGCSCCTDIDIRVKSIRAVLRPQTHPQSRIGQHLDGFAWENDQGITYLFGRRHDKMRDTERKHV